MDAIPLAAAVEEATPQGIAAAISRLISSGDLAPGDRLPTVRELASELGVSPATVSHAWQALAGVGLIVSRGRSGSFVRPRPNSWLPQRFRNLEGQPMARLDLSSGTPDPELLPDLGPALSRVSARAHASSYLDRPVVPELERVLRESWPYEPQAITIVDGALDGLSRTLDAVVRFGDRVVLEDPGFPPLFDLVEQLQAERVPVGLDADGIRPEALAEALNRAPAVIVLQPRAHNPTGISMSAGRAHELARVISRHRNGGQTVIVEDDHSGAIAAHAEVTLARWIPEQVVHIRSFSKTHGPDLRIAALSGPSELVDRIVARRMLGPAWTSRMLQSILLELLTDPAAVSAVAGARSVYRARQKRLADALGRHGIDAHLADGINTWIGVADERVAIVTLAAAGIRVAGGSAFQAVPRGEFVRVTAGRITADFDTVGAAIAQAAHG